MRNVRVNLMLPPQLWKDLRFTAAKEGQSRSNFIRTMLIEAVHARRRAPVVPIRPDPVKESESLDWQDKRLYVGAADEEELNELMDINRSRASGGVALFDIRGYREYLAHLTD